jgi:hypothetical protein
VWLHVSSFTPSFSLLLAATRNPNSIRYLSTPQDSFINSTQSHLINSTDSRFPFTTLFCLQLLNPGLQLQGGISRRTKSRPVSSSLLGLLYQQGWDGQLGGNPTWRPSSIVLTVCGCHAAGDEVASVARFDRLDSSSSSSSGGIYSYACSLVRSELSWWGLKSSLQSHVAHTHYGSHYSFRSLINSALPSVAVDLHARLCICR